MEEPDSLERSYSSCGTPDRVFLMATMADVIWDTVALYLHEHIGFRV